MPEVCSECCRVSARRGGKWIMCLLHVESFFFINLLASQNNRWRVYLHYSDVFMRTGGECLPANATALQGRNCFYKRSFSECFCSEQQKQRW